MTAFIGIAIIVVYFEAQLPDVYSLKDVDWQMPLKIYTQDNVLIGEFGPQRRTPITIDQVPKPLIEAILATEDQRFFEHIGIDPWGIARAFIELIVTGRKVQGGSTITMQVARNYFLTSEKTFSRKIKEILLAIKIDRTFPKDKILELYLNKIYFGNRAYGVAAAAQVYYGKNLNELTLPQMAMLAGIPKAPSELNPLANKAAAKDRRDHVLKRMYELGYITKIAFKEAVAAPLTATYHNSNIDNLAPYVAEMVRDAMYAHLGASAYTEGYNVYTTIDSKLQQAADQALQTAIDAYNKRHRLTSSENQVQGALIAMNPQSGAVLALDGGLNYSVSNFNRVTQAQRQPGSTFKPFYYSAALSRGYTLSTLLNDSPVSMYDAATGGYWQPQNDNHKIYGPIRLREALARSLNLASIHLLQHLGLYYAIDFVTRFGFTENQLPHNLTLALGTAVATPLQMATAYTTFANGGYKINPYLIDKITTTSGRNIYQAQPKLACESCIAAHPAPGMSIVQPNQLAPQILTPQVAFLMTSAMKDVIREGTAHSAASLNRADIAGKTGTTDTDGWFIGFNSDIVAAAWLGFDNPKPIREYGSTTALPMWIAFMQTALQGKPLHTLPIPSGIVSQLINQQTGQPADSDDPQAKPEWFEETHLAGSGPTWGSSPDSDAQGAPVVNGITGENESAPSGNQEGAPIEDGTKEGAYPGNAEPLF